MEGEEGEEEEHRIRPDFLVRYQSFAACSGHRHDLNRCREWTNAAGPTEEDGNSGYLRNYQMTSQNLQLLD